MVLEAGSLKSRCAQNHGPSEGSRKGFFLLASENPGCSLPCSLNASVSASLSCNIFSCLSLYASTFSFSCKTPSHIGLKAPANSVWLYLNLIISAVSKQSLMHKYWGSELPHTFLKDPIQAMRAATKFSKTLDERIPTPQSPGGFLPSLNLKKEKNGLGITECT